jgi:hypothetical protein
MSRFASLTSVVTLACPALWCDDKRLQKPQGSGIALDSHSRVWNASILSSHSWLDTWSGVLDYGCCNSTFACAWTSLTYVDV